MHLHVQATSGRSTYGQLDDGARLSALPETLRKE